MSNVEPEAASVVSETPLDTITCKPSVRSKHLRCEIERKTETDNWIAAKFPSELSNIQKGQSSNELVVIRHAIAYTDDLMKFMQPIHRKGESFTWHRWVREVAKMVEAECPRPNLRELSYIVAILRGDEFVDNM